MVEAAVASLAVVVEAEVDGEDITHLGDLEAEDMTRTATMQESAGEWGIQAFGAD